MLFRCLEGDAEALARVECSPKAADDFPDPFAVGTEVPQGSANIPRRSLECHRDLAGGRAPSESPQSLQSRSPGPANHAESRTGGDQAFVQIMGEKIDGIVQTVTQHTEAQSDWSGQAAASGDRPKGGGPLSRQGDPRQIIKRGEAVHIRLHRGFGADKSGGQYPIGLGSESR